jgi:hypothetical protein
MKRKESVGGRRVLKRRLAKGRIRLGGCWFLLRSKLGSIVEIKSNRTGGICHISWGIKITTKVTTILCKRQQSEHERHINSLLLAPMYLVGWHTKIPHIRSRHTFIECTHCLQRCLMSNCTQPGIRYCQSFAHQNWRCKNSCPFHYIELLVVSL